MRHAEHLGSDTYLYVTLGEGAELTVRLAGQSEIAIGARVGLSPQGGPIHRFGADGKVL